MQLINLNSSNKLIWKQCYATVYENKIDILGHCFHTGVKATEFKALSVTVQEKASSKAIYLSIYFTKIKFNHWNSCLKVCSEQSSTSKTLGTWYTHLDEGLSGVPGVWANNESRILTPLHHSLFQLVPPDMLTSLKNVITVANHSYRPRGKLVQQTLECVLLSAPTPGDDGTT